MTMNAEERQQANDIYRNVEQELTRMDAAIWQLQCSALLSKSERAQLINNVLDKRYRLMQSQKALGAAIILAKADKKDDWEET
jgi:hypothetical protein